MLGRRRLMMKSTQRMISLDSFCLRQFDDPDYTGTQIRFDKCVFTNCVNELYDNGKCELVDGYAPFCKHLFIENFTDTHVNALEITEENQALLKSGYEARTPKELPVLGRWFPADLVSTHVAKYLDIILYSREQIRKENQAMNVEVSSDTEPWGIISVKAQDSPCELPMQPITMMRNALGRTEGGSGVPLSKEEYLKSVEYWQHHAIVKK